MAEKWDYAVELEIKGAELTSLYWRSLHEMAEATLAVLEHDTEQNRGRAWHLAHKFLGHESWCGVEIDPEQFDGTKCSFCGLDWPAHAFECPGRNVQQIDGEAR